MNILEQRILRGPNLWSDLPCIMTLVADFDADQPDQAARLASELQQQAGHDCRFWRSAYAENRLTCRIVVAYQSEKLALRAIDLALAAVMGTGDARREEDIDALRDLAGRSAIGTSTAAVIAAARARGIPVSRITEDANLFQLGWGRRQQRLQATVTGATSHIAVGIAGNKQLTKTLLDQAGIPVPKGTVANTVEEAIAAAERLRFPVTVKPLDGNQGKGVTTQCRDALQVAAAFDFARQYGRRVIVERHLDGRDYRLLVTGGKLAAASLRRPPSVCGDGVSSVRQLLDAENAKPARAEGHAGILTTIKLDTVALDLLAEQGLTADSVAPLGTQVRLRGNANLSTGGTAEDVTALVHPATRDMCIRAAAAIGLDVAGIDLVCGDIAQCLRSQGGGIIEVNAAPGIRMHEYPSDGPARQAGAAIVDAMFGDGDGRIPVVAVTGTNGKTTTTLMIAHTARLARLVTGVTTTEGVFIDGKRIVEGDCAGYHSARAVLNAPEVDFAVLETARGGILKRGLAFDRCSVGVVLNVSDDHLGLDGIDTVDQLAQVKAVVARAASGAAVLNADDLHCVAMAATLRPEVEVIYFSLDPRNPVLLRHLQAHGRAVCLEDGAIVLAQGQRRHFLLDAAAMPAALQGHATHNIANALAAAAALMACGFTGDAIAQGLGSFVSDIDSNPLRSNLYQVNGVTVLVDYAHNPAACRALAALARSLSGGKRVAVMTAPGDRRDTELFELGRTYAAGFDQLFAYEADPRGRPDGATAACILDGARAGGMAPQGLRAIIPALDAFDAALAACHPGDILVFACGSSATAQAALRPHLARQASTLAPV